MKYLLSIIMFASLTACVGTVETSKEKVKSEVVTEAKSNPMEGMPCHKMGNGEMMGDC